MSRRPPTGEQLETLRAVFRRSPPSTPRDFKTAGSLAGVTEAAARRAYSRGWPGIEAIETQLARERHIAAQSAEVLKVERVVTSMKANVVTLQNEVRRLQPVIRALTDNLIGAEADLSVLHPEAAVKTLQRLAKVHKDVAAISAKTVELDRLIAGEATSIVGHKAIESEPVDIEKAQALNERMNRALRRAQAAQPVEQAAEAKDVADVVDTSVN